MYPFQLVIRPVMSGVMSVMWSTIVLVTRPLLGHEVMDPTCASGAARSWSLGIPDWLESCELVGISGVAETQKLEKL